MNTKRKPIPKKLREEIYIRYNGRCGYCGKEIALKDMQVDHIQSIYWNNGDNNVANYRASCRMCNFYKRALPVEQFRQNIQNIHENLEKIFIYRLAVQYGLIEEHRKPIQFYFETLEKGDQTP